MSLSYDMQELAEQLLLQGKDRLPWKFDGRHLRGLGRRSGLLRYPDGTFSVSGGVMEDAIRSWSILSKDTHLSEPVRAKFLNLIQRGKRWQEPAPVIPGMKFGDLTADQYAALWELVIRGEHPMWKHEPHMSQRERTLWNQLQKRGHVTAEVKGETMHLTPTPKANQLVLELGSPNANHRQASYDFR